MSFGHHPDPLTDAQVEVDRLEGLLYNARAGLERALDLRVASPAGQTVKRDVRWALEQSELGRDVGGGLLRAVRAARHEG